MYFHTRFSIRSIHKYVCVIYSFMSDIFVSFHKIMSVAHGVFAPGLLALRLPVFLWRLLSGGNRLQKTIVEYTSLVGAAHVGGTTLDWEVVQTLKPSTCTMLWNNQPQVTASSGATMTESVSKFDNLADKTLVRAMHDINVQMQKDFLFVQFASASAHGTFSPQSEAHR
jgi:hypothetical protein